MQPSHPIETDALTRLDNLPWTRFHTLMLVALGVGWALDSFETNIIGSVFGVLKSHWHLSAAQGSLAVSIWVFGMLVGAIAFGYLADRYGRVRMLQWTIATFALFTCLSGFTHSFWQLLATRTLQGFGFGGEWSVVTIMMAETIR
ncbi:MFS transporter, partial [Bacillus licheniformis]|nr:MFS transporter [Bacillus licheniformis]